MENKKMSIRFTMMAVLLITILCIALTPRTLQNDTYYTIKIGEYIVENGITMKDPFSWHEDLDYTYPHWAYDVCTYLVYKIGGFERHICCNSNFDSCFRTNCIFYKCEIS